MPQPHLRTRSRKRRKKVLPSGKNKTQFKREKTKALSCFICNKPIAGKPCLNTAEIRKQSRSKRRVRRPYGGQICCNCLKDSLKQTARTM